MTGDVALRTAQILRSDTLIAQSSLRLFWGCMFLAQGLFGLLVDVWVVFHIMSLLQVDVHKSYDKVCTPQSLIGQTRKMSWRPIPNKHRGVARYKHVY